MVAVSFKNVSYVEKIGFTDSDIDQFKRVIVVKTRQNQFVPMGAGDTAVHLTATYGCKRSLESFKYPFHFIADDYFTQYQQELFQNERDKLRFRQFLEDISVNEFLQMNRVTTGMIDLTPICLTCHIRSLSSSEFRDVSELNPTPWAYLIESLSDSIMDPFEIRDIRCDEFERLLSSEDDPRKKFSLCVDLFQYLHDLYRDTAPFYTASIVLKRNRYGGYGDTNRGIPSSFCSLLRNSSWIPVGGDTLSKPADAYYFPTDSIFQQYLPHIDTTRLQLKNSDFICSILGIQSNVSTRTIFELLMKWSCNLDSESLWTLIKQSGTLPTYVFSIDDVCDRYCIDILL